MCLQGAGQVVENKKSFKLGISRLVIKTHFHLPDLFVHFTRAKHHVKPWKCWDRPGLVSSQAHTVGEGRGKQAQWLFVLLVKQKGGAVILSQKAMRKAL